MELQVVNMLLLTDKPKSYMYQWILMLASMLCNMNTIFLFLEC